MDRIRENDKPSLTQAIERNESAFKFSLTTTIIIIIYGAYMSRYSFSDAERRFTRKAKVIILNTALDCLPTTNKCQGNTI